jgi:predicted RNA methylase
VQTLIKIGSHPEIDFSGTPLELATALYLERFKRGTPWSGFFPTPAVAAAWAADLLPLNRGAVVLDPGCGFGSLSYAAQQRGAVPQMVEWSSAVVPIAQAIWGEAQVQYRDFLDGFRPTEFDAVLANPPFGNVFGHSDAAGDFLERIAELSRGGTYVSAILPRDYLSVERPKRRVEIAQRFTIIEKHDLNPDTFKPLTNIATTLYLLTVRRDGALVGEVRPRALARPESTAEVDQSIVVSCSAVSTETADESQSITADSDYQWKEPKFYPAIRGDQTVVVVARSVAEVDAEVQAGTCLLNSVGFDSRAKALDWLEHNTSTWQVDAGRDEAGNCLQCGEGGRCQCPHNRTAQSFQIDLDGDLIRADYHPDRAIGRDVCFDFHGPLVSATGYLTRFVARDTTLTLYEQAKAEVALAAAAWQQQRAKNFKTWPVKYAGDVAVRMADQVMRGCPISWNEHEQAWHIWLIREERAATVAADNVLENWATYFAAQLQPGDHIVYQPYPGQARLDADFVRVVPGEGWEVADDGHVEVKRRRDEKVQLARLSDLIGLWDEL